MVRVVHEHDFKASPWKNGGGITREIARLDAAENFGWRLSVADVKASGPFSLFPGHSRILVVVSGKGMKLVSSATTLDAMPHVPVQFSGKMQIDGQLIEGDCRDFNLIFDPKRFAADVQLVTGIPTKADCFGFYILEGRFIHENQCANVGDFVFLETQEPKFDTSQNIQGLAVFIKPL